VLDGSISEVLWTHWSSHPVYPVEKNLDVIFGRNIIERDGIFVKIKERKENLGVRMFLEETDNLFFIGMCPPF
jgi:hypothetical protein